MYAIGKGPGVALGATDAVMQEGMVCFSDAGLVAGRQPSGGQSSLGTVLAESGHPFPDSEHKI